MPVTRLTVKPAIHAADAGRQSRQKDPKPEECVCGSVRATVRCERRRREFEFCTSAAACRVSPNCRVHPWCRRLPFRLPFSDWRVATAVQSVSFKVQIRFVLYSILF
ncbi:Uncharacterized protein Adt_07298 [Abeliophyllum distichum]|uniref:Uncharacterized protein n=1 Tax=Abeliophyllum distichum TaxID=126358 RepID=A0ABD1V9P4_9LAMI